MHNLTDAHQTLFCICLTLCCVALTPTVQARADDLDALKSQVEVSEEGTIRLPLRVHIMTHLKIPHPTNRAEPLECWLRESDVNAVVSEINLIWKQAKIEWFVESIVEHRGATTKTDAIDYIVHAERDANGRSDPNRIPKVYSFFDAGKQHPAIQNLYVFPFIGNTSQGYAGDPNDRKVRSIKSNHAVVGIWSNKGSGGGQPYRTAIKERPRSGLGNTPPQKENFFHEGSLGRTCAHELGHHLGLAHPNKETQSVFKRLMGGKKPGYRLTPDEIATARTQARKRGNRFLNWTP